MPRSPNALLKWIARIFAFVVGLGVVVLAFFFLAAAVAAGAILASAILLRLWWLRRRLKASADSGVIAGEYTIVRRERVGEEPPGPGAEGSRSER